eukprot:Sspe_Gene.45959::Locus_22833_Transcript_1_1_Confidence_1.000_Length_658::g.45959::m.45959
MGPLSPFFLKKKTPPNPVGQRDGILYGSGSRLAAKKNHRSLEEREERGSPPLCLFPTMVESFLCLLTALPPLLPSFLPLIFFGGQGKKNRKPNCPTDMTLLAPIASSPLPLSLHSLCG